MRNLAHTVAKKNPGATGIAAGAIGIANVKYIKFINSLQAQ